MNVKEHLSVAGKYAIPANSFGTTVGMIFANAGVSADIAIGLSGMFSLMANIALIYLAKSSSTVREALEGTTDIPASIATEYKKARLSN